MKVLDEISGKIVDIEVDPETESWAKEIERRRRVKIEHLKEGTKDRAWLVQAALYSGYV